MFKLKQKNVRHCLGIWIVLVTTQGFHPTKAVPLGSNERIFTTIKQGRHNAIANSNIKLRHPQAPFQAAPPSNLNSLIQSQGTSRTKLNPTSERFDKPYYGFLKNDNKNFIMNKEVGVNNYGVTSDKFTPRFDQRRRGISDSDSVLGKGYSVGPKQTNSESERATTSSLAKYLALWLVSQNQNSGQSGNKRDNDRFLHQTAPSDALNAQDGVQIYENIHAPSKPLNDFHITNQNSPIEITRKSHEKRNAELGGQYQYDDIFTDEFQNPYGGSEDRIYYYYYDNNINKDGNNYPTMDNNKGRYHESRPYGYSNSGDNNANSDKDYHRRQKSDLKTKHTKRTVEDFTEGLHPQHFINDITKDAMDEKENFIKKIQVEISKNNSYGKTDKESFLRDSQNEKERRDDLKDTLLEKQKINIVTDLQSATPRGTTMKSDTPEAIITTKTTATKITKPPTGTTSTPTPENVEELSKNIYNKVGDYNGFKPDISSYGGTVGVSNVNENAAFNVSGQEKESDFLTKDGYGQNTDPHSIHDNIKGSTLVDKSSNIGDTNEDNNTSFLEKPKFAGFKTSHPQTNRTRPVLEPKANNLDSHQLIVSKHDSNSTNSNEIIRSPISSVGGKNTSHSIQGDSQHRDISMASVQDVDELAIGQHAWRPNTTAPIAPIARIDNNSSTNKTINLKIEIGTTKHNASKPGLEILPVDIQKDKNHPYTSDMHQPGYLETSNKSHIQMKEMEIKTLDKTRESNSTIVEVTDQIRPKFNVSMTKQTISVSDTTFNADETMEQNHEQGKSTQSVTNNVTLTNITRESKNQQESSFLRDEILMTVESKLSRNVSKNDTKSAELRPDRILKLNKGQHQIVGTAIKLDTLVGLQQSTSLLENDTTTKDKSTNDSSVYSDLDNIPSNFQNTDNNKIIYDKPVKSVSKSDTKINDTENTSRVKKGKQDGSSGRLFIEQSSQPEHVGANSSSFIEQSSQQEHFSANSSSFIEQSSQPEHFGANSSSFIEQSSQPEHFGSNSSSFIEQSSQPEHFGANSSSFIEQSSQPEHFGANSSSLIEQSSQPEHFGANSSSFLEQSSQPEHFGANSSSFIEQSSQPEHFGVNFSSLIEQSSQPEHFGGNDFTAGVNITVNTTRSTIDISGSTFLKSLSQQPITVDDDDTNSKTSTHSFPNDLETNSTEFRDDDDNNAYNTNAFLTSSVHNLSYTNLSDKKTTRQHELSYFTKSISDLDENDDSNENKTSILQVAHNSNTANHQHSTTTTIADIKQIKNIKTLIKTDNESFTQLNEIDNSQNDIITMKAKDYAQAQIAESTQGQQRRVSRIAAHTTLNKKEQTSSLNSNQTTNVTINEYQNHETSPLPPTKLDPKQKSKNQNQDEAYPRHLEDPGLNRYHERNLLTSFSVHHRHKLTLEDFPSLALRRRANADERVKVGSMALKTRAIRPLNPYNDKDGKMYIANNDVGADAQDPPKISAYRSQDFSLRKPEDWQIKSQENPQRDEESAAPNSSANQSPKGERPSDMNTTTDTESKLNPPRHFITPPPIPQARAAVSAVLTSHFGPTNQQIIPFDLELLDLADNYDNETGMFIATIPGTYVISVYLMSHPGAKVNARVYVNDRPVAALWADDSGHAGFYPSSSIQTISQLGFGDQVYVMLVDGGYGDSWVHANYNVFTIFLLYQETFS